MPTRAPHICEGCKQEIVGICQNCASPTSKGWSNDDGRPRGRALQRLRANLFAAEPFCRTCIGQGRQVLATVRDHIINRADGGTEDLSNIQPLCDDCHQIKTQNESKFGRAKTVGR